MKFFKTWSIIVIAIIVIACCSCASTHKTVYYGVGYQSIRPNVYKEADKIPDDCSIVTAYFVNDEGELTVVVSNNTDEIMVIDQTRSFLVNTDGLSQSYYDPTVRTQTVTDLSQQTTGASVNLGAIGGLLGVKGKVGGLLNGINVGGSTTDGTSTSTTTYFADQAQIALGPHGTGAMSKNFQLKGIGASALKLQHPVDVRYNNPNGAPVKFSVCISYSLDNGETFDKVVTDFYMNAMMFAPVSSPSDVNNGLRSILQSKTDALTEPCGLIYFNSSANSKNKSYQTGNVFVDYK